MVYCSIKSWRIVRGVANRKISTWVTKFVHWRFFTYFSAKLERIFHLTCTNFRVNNENSKEVLTMDHFELVSEYAPTGDQPQAIEQLVKGFQKGNQCQTY